MEAKARKTTKELTESENIKERMELVVPTQLKKARKQRI